MVEPEQTRLTASQIERLTPLLHELVTAVSHVGVPDERALGALLGTAGLSGEAWAGGELRLWARLLARVRNTQDDTQALTVRQALMDRGVREAPAMLAVDMLVRA